MIIHREPTTGKRPAARLKGSPNPRSSAGSVGTNAAVAAFRIHITLTADAYEKLRIVAGKTKAAAIDDVVRDALRTYEELVTEVCDGKDVHLVPSGTKSYGTPVRIF